jgi:hypothetical protein
MNGAAASQPLRLFFEALKEAFIKILLYPRSFFTGYKLMTFGQLETDQMLL